jgi:hypothetical protein
LNFKNKNAIFDFFGPIVENGQIPNAEWNYLEIYIFAEHHWG